MFRVQHSAFMVIRMQDRPRLEKWMMSKRIYKWRFFGRWLAWHIFLIKHYSWMTAIKISFVMSVFEMNIKGGIFRIRTQLHHLYLQNHKLCPSDSIMTIIGSFTTNSPLTHLNIIIRILSLIKFRYPSQAFSGHQWHLILYTDSKQNAALSSGFSPQRQS